MNFNGLNKYQRFLNGLRRNIYLNQISARLAQRAVTAPGCMGGKARDLAQGGLSPIYITKWVFNCFFS